MTRHKQPAAVLLACLALVGCQDPYTAATQRPPTTHRSGYAAPAGRPAARRRASAAAPSPPPTAPALR